MWVEKSKNGKFKFVERYTDPMTEKSKKISVTFDKDNRETRKTAYDVLQKRIDDLLSTRSTDVDKLTFKDLVERYRKYQQKTVKPSTYRRNYHATTTLMKILGEDTLISKLNASYIKDCLLESGNEANTLNEHIIRLKALLNWAFDNDLLEDISFLRKVKPFKSQTKKAKIEDKYLEPEELQTLLKGMDHCMYWFYLAKFMSLSGLRVGEAAALERKDVDLKEHTIYVTKTYDFNNLYLSETPKTDTSNREVFIQPELEALIKEINIYNATRKLQYGYQNPNQIFMPSKEGDYISYYAFNKYLKEKSNKVLGREVTTHILRHTHSSLLYSQDVDFETLARRLGHKNSRITKEIYTHVTKRLKEKDNAQIRNTKII
ncbi:MAG: tyrosine-type recombinase/integrase [Lachnospiraceae bacterium]